MSTPVTVLGGYLGAGKTTLINRLLSQPLDRKLAVLVNDFGSINIDAQLIAAHDGETLALTNGCVCCSIAGGLGSALEGLRGSAIDQVLIEASGAAVPAKVAEIADTWPGYHLARTLTLVDASAWRRQLNDKYIGNLARAQLSGATLRLVTKLDLSDQPDCEVADIERQFGPTRALCQNHLEPALILECDPDPVQLSTTAPTTAPIITEPPPFSSRVLEFDQPLPYAETLALLGALTDHLERAKGWVLTDRGQQIVQLGGGRATLTGTDRRPEPANQLVLIGAEPEVQSAVRRFNALGAVS